MKGRRRVHDHPVQRNITLEFWLDEMLDDCKRIGLRPGDIIQAGLISIFQSENKFPPALIKSFLTHIKPKEDTLKELREYYEKELQLIDTLPQKPVKNNEDADCGVWSGEE